MINNVQMNGINAVKDYRNAGERNSAKTASEGEKTSGKTGMQKQDFFVKSYEADSEKVTYSKPKTDYSKQVESLMEQHEKQIEDFKNKILSMIRGQSDFANGKRKNFGLQGMNLNINININVTFGTNAINPTDEDIAAAQKAISEDGEWGVNAVADRIMNFAYALADGDESKIQVLKNAVIAGFKAAGFDNGNREGCGMPEITGQTYDEIMTRFDKWENGEE